MGLVKMDREGAVALRWLDSVPLDRQGVQWGVPWAQGALAPGAEFELRHADGQRLGVDSWPLAVWPDGSLKWTGHAARVPGLRAEGIALCVRKPEAARDEGGGLVVEDGQARIIVDTGAIRVGVPKSGDLVVDEIAAGGITTCSGARLVARVERRSDAPGGRVAVERRLRGLLTDCEVERRGQESCVIRLEGRHEEQATAGTKAWLPFVLRMYLYRGSSRIRLVHSIVFDGDAQEDFLSAVGVTLHVPIRGAAYNRHVRIAGEAGVFCEPSQLLLTRRYRDADGLYPAQITGRTAELGDASRAGLRELLREQACWDEFRVVQDSPDHYAIEKRTRPGCAWVCAAHGARAGGVLAVAGEGPGLSIGIGDFWQKWPRELSAKGLTKDSATLDAWFWSPTARPMDLRHYDTEPHVWSAYEGFEEVRGDPYGVANTNELWMEPYSAASDLESVRELAEAAQRPPLLVCEPERYHDTEVLGVWSLPDTTTEPKAWLEAQLEALEGFYREEVEQRRWYGFWDYGDVMHTYDQYRHAWRYDLGGYAWQNTELAPNLWLWYSFLRSGRSETFRLAAAMARHTSEVDVYHLGQYRGLGSRHNVRHWGCSCKEARISMAGLHRPYYYLTGDERVGDLFQDVADHVEAALLSLDPARTLVPTDGSPTHVRTGPDWAALCSNWMTEWERSGSRESLDAIRAGLSSISSAPLGLLSGPVFGYDPVTRQLRHIGDDNYSYHMIVAFGAPEMWMELARLLPDEPIGDMLERFGTVAAMSPAERSAATGGAIGVSNFRRSVFYSRLIAYAAARTADAGLGEEAWALLLESGSGGTSLPASPEQIEGIGVPRQVRELPWVSTNAVSQWCLSVIENLELIPGELDATWVQTRRDELPARDGPAGGPR